MGDLVKSAVTAPVPKLFILGGLIFLGIAVVGRIRDKIDPGKWGRVASAVLGLILVVAGLRMQRGATTSRGRPPAQLKGPTIQLREPIMLEPAEGAVLANHPRQTTLRWTPVPGAASYSVKIEYCEPSGCQDATARSLKLVTGLTSTFYTFDFVGAVPGRWRVWAVGADGRESPKPRFREFRYTR